MSAYYSENDPFAAAWLRELIKAGLIAEGEVDERSIKEVTANDVRGFTQCHFFAGIGGWSYALRLAGWPDEREVWTGSCPCQPFSQIGFRDGETDPRHLWPTWFQLIRIARPDVVFGEQVEAAIAGGWLDVLCDDLESESYAVGTISLPAACVGGRHTRQRLWFVADGERLQAYASLSRAGYEAVKGGLSRRSVQMGGAAIWLKPRPSGAIPFEVGNGIPGSMVRLRGYGNAIVPQVAQVFIEAYMDAVTV